MGEMRTCKTCRKPYPLSRSNFGSTPSGGYRYKCRSCMRAHVKDYDNASTDRKRAAVERAQRRTHLSATERVRFIEKLLKRDGRLCFYCHQTLSAEFHLDHMQPAAKGGGDTLQNLVLACLQCNQEKHNKTVDEYRVWRRLNRLSVLF